MLIFIRHGKYLTNRYKWADIPDLFPTWHFNVVLNVMRKAAPTAFAVVDEKQAIDLDKLEVFEMGV